MFLSRTTESLSKSPPHPPVCPSAWRREGPREHPAPWDPCGTLCLQHPGVLWLLAGLDCWYESESQGKCQQPRGLSLVSRDKQPAWSWERGSVSVIWYPGQHWLERLSPRQAPLTTGLAKSSTRCRERGPRGGKHLFSTWMVGLTLHFLKNTLVIGRP